MAPSLPPPSADVPTAASQSPEEIAKRVAAFLRDHPKAVALEDGKVVFELAQATHRLTTAHGRCLLEIWSGERNLVRTIAEATSRKGSLRLSTERFGYTQTKLLEVSAGAPPRQPGKREAGRQQYLRLLKRVLAREFPDWTTEAFRTAMDLERSFGPGYARGTLVRGKEAWAVIGVGAGESQATIDGVLTLGVLWLHHCRERGVGRYLYKGLRVIVPRGSAALTLARLAWMNTSAAQWELYELDEPTEALLEQDASDQGNVRTRLVHHPDAAAAQERFSGAIRQVMRLVPAGEDHRVEQRLRSASELAFLLHGLEFARARIALGAGSFANTVKVTVGEGAAETPLLPADEMRLREHVAELFARRTADVVRPGRVLRPLAPGRSVGAFTGRPAHNRMSARSVDSDGSERLALRERALAAQQDPLFRAAPERWLESVLRESLAPLTRSLAPVPRAAGPGSGDGFANDPDPDSRGNRAGEERPADSGWSRRARNDRQPIIPRFDPRYVYSQVPAIAGAGDRGMLDLLGVTEDGRLAVIEIKATDDLQLALQGLDYWIRVRHHHASTIDPATGQTTGLNDLQRHGYFRDLELSPLPPRLFLVAPALRIHPATETVLRYLSSRVEWTLLALDERWRQEIRVVWRRSSGGSR